VERGRETEHMILGSFFGCEQSLVRLEGEKGNHREKDMFEI
jgi:hypothetical protein